MANLKITLVKSTIGCPQNQKDTAKALGLRKLHMTVERPDNEAVRGQIKTIRHLVKVEEA
ncbi:MAG: 50S ribosomal protein L30 [Christensenellaceae bacterium]|nr:50S ribosomal protein L30 [Christensenellaceae bacterium]